MDAPVGPLAPVRSNIGQGWTRPGIALACLVAVATLGLDLGTSLGAGYSQSRLVLGLVAVLVLAWLPGGSPATLGIRRGVDPDWRFWVRKTALLGGIVVLGALGVSAVFWAMGHPVWAPPMFHGTAEFWPYLGRACVQAPFEEELIYRVVLCALWRPFLPRKYVVVLGGLAFAGLHGHYGNLAPNHLFAGLVLTWAYLRSGQWAVPLVLHMLGNFAVFALEASRYALSH